MEIKIISRNNSVTNGMKEEARLRLNVIEKFLNDNDQIKLSVTSIKNEVSLSAMLVYEGKLVKVEKRGEDYYELLSEMADSLKTKLQRLHTKKIKRWQDQEHALSDIEYDHEADEKDSIYQIVKTKHIVLEDMTPEQAVETMEDLGHESFIFKDINTGKICMVYTRNDAKYGLIEAD